MMTAQHIAFAVAAVLGGYLAWPLAPKVWSKFKPVPMSDPAVAPLDTRSNGAVEDAIYVLRTNVTDVEGQEIITQFVSYWWKRKMPKLTATFTPGTPQ